MWNLMIDRRLPQNFQFVPESYCSDRMCWTGENDKIVKMTSRDCSIPPRRPWAIIDCIHYLVEFLLSRSSTSCSNANYLCNGKRIIVTLMPLLCIVVLHERFRAIDSATFFCFIMRANLLLWNKIFIQLWILHRYPLSYEHFMVPEKNALDLSLSEQSLKPLLYIWYKWSIYYFSVHHKYMSLLADKWVETEETLNVHNLHEWDSTQQHYQLHLDSYHTCLYSTTFSFARKDKFEFVYLQSQYTKKIYLNSSIQPNGAFTVLTYLELETTTLKNYSSLLYSFECYSNQMVVYTAMGKLGTEFHHGAERNWSYLGFLSSVSIQCWNDFLFGTFCDLMLNQEFYNCQQL